MLTIPVTIEGAATRADGTLKIVVGANELPPETMTEVFRLRGKFCYVALKAEDFGKAEIERLEALQADLTDDPRKSYSARLRAVLYRLWEQDKQGFKEFEAFYASKMEALIRHYKDKLA